MHTPLDNPFSVTKATEFSDQQIYQYWVDFNSANDSIFKLLNPTELMPKFIIGSKGCGKTHLLRYYSFPIQLIRNNNDINKIIQNDKYFGLYVVFGGINSSRFSGKGISDDQWEQIFEYYLELYLGSKILSTVQEIIAKLDLADYKIKSIVNEVAQRIATKYTDVVFDDFSDIVDYLNKIRKDIDVLINNAALTRNIDITALNIRFGPGDLIFGIPEIVTNGIVELKDVKFIYILDELEKFTEMQKIYVNTLLWDKKFPSTFWIGSRSYGYTTNMTKTSEKLRHGSEYELIPLDDVIRNDESQYLKFSIELCRKRITNLFTNSVSKIEAKFNMDHFFEINDDSDIVKKVSIKFSKKEYPHITYLRQKLNDAIKKGLLKKMITPKDITTIITKLRFEENPILEKCKIFYFYQLWFNEEYLLDAAENVNLEFSNYQKRKESKFNNIIEKYKKDLIAQLLNDCGFRASHFSGFEDIVNISWGNPRALLVILKKIYQWSVFQGEKPFEKDHISIDAQNAGIYDASKWFYEDAEIIGQNGKSLYTSISNIAEYLRGIRFSDKPSESSPSAFSLKMNDISENSKQIVKLAKDHSFFIELDQGRKDKNSDRVDRLYQINKMLAPLYNLPIARRGTINLTAKFAESIFNPEKHTEFNKFYNEAIGRMNAPEFGKKTKNTMSNAKDLFS